MNRPTLLLTRPLSGARSLLARIDPVILQRVTVVLSPLIQIAPFDAAPDLAGYAGVVLTSANGVTFAPAGMGLSAYCVGKATALAAAAAGWSVALIAQDADDLVARIPSNAAGPLLHLAGRFRRGDIAARLTERGLTTDVSEIYDQRLQPLSAAALQALGSGEGAIVPLFSPRTATQFADQARGARGVIAVCISAAAAEALAGFETKAVIIAEAPTAEAMLYAIENAIGRTSLA